MDEGDTEDQDDLKGSFEVESTKQHQDSLNNKDSEGKEGRLLSKQTIGSDSVTIRSWMRIYLEL